ncbi:MAG: ABC transporter ATP-binding protein [Planctomycetes bacterium]|nr:ABC transporter ATP-binding protein [Planctomycetota bacterium]
MGGHMGPGPRGGKDGEKKKHRSHPVFSQDRKGSKELFRQFIKERGIFGNKKPEKTEKADDPENQQAESPEAEASSSENSAKKAEKSRSTGYYLRKYLHLLSDQKLRLLTVVLLCPLLVGMHMLMPWSSKYFIDTILPQDNLNLLYKCCGALLALLVLWVILSIVQDYLQHCLIGNIITSTKRKLMKHFQQMPLERIQELKVGGVISRLQSDTEASANLLHQAILTPLNAALMLIGSIGSLSLINWQVTVICLAFCTVVIAITYVFFNIMRPYQKSIREELAAIGGHLAETFSGIQLVRAFSRERAETKAFATQTNLLWRKGLWATILNIAVHRSVRLIHMLIYVSIWAVGGYFYINDNMKTGDLVAFTMFIGWLFQPIFMIMGSFSAMQTSFACAERIFDLLEEPSSMPDVDDAEAKETFEEAIVFDNVNFDYPDGTRALHDINLTIPQGKVTALVGPSGAGKTTITNLVMRFYDATDGCVLMDGKDIRQMRLMNYRKLTGLVLQEIFLFDGSIKENILYSRPGAKMEEVERAAKMAHCTEFIDNLENKFDTIIGERGIKLSVGQKQRLALARAILRDPQIMILDEATSNLDSESESLIQDALRNIFENRTTLVIAHRLSTIMDADNIVVVDKGRIAEQGTHEELLKAQGRYYQLYMKQMEKAERSKTVFDWTDENGGEEE